MVGVGLGADVVCRSSCQSPRRSQRIPQDVSAVTVATVDVRETESVRVLSREEAALSDVLRDFDFHRLALDLDECLAGSGAEGGFGGEGVDACAVGLEVVESGDGVVHGDGLAGCDGDELGLVVRVEGELHS